MSKNLLFFADGTWDGADDDESDPTRGRTNVFKLFENLEGTEDTATAQSEKERERGLRTPKAVSCSMRNIFMASGTRISSSPDGSAAVWGQVLLGGL